MPRSDSMTLGDKGQEVSNNMNRQNKVKKPSQKSNNFVGALNQGLVSLGEKLGKNFHIKLFLFYAKVLVYFEILTRD